MSACLHNTRFVGVRKTFLDVGLQDVVLQGVLNDIEARHVVSLCDDELVGHWSIEVCVVSLPVHLLQAIQQKM